MNAASKQTPPETQPYGMIRISLASQIDRTQIYKIRHNVYATEIGQHLENEAGRLTDALDESNLYLVARRGERVVGFVSITTPEKSNYSIDKYVDRSQFDKLTKQPLYEFRLLTVVESERNGIVAALLLYGAYRTAQAQGAECVVVMGRQEILGLYQRFGFRLLGSTIHSGEAVFELMSAGIEEIEQEVVKYSRLINRLESASSWDLGIPFFHEASSYREGTPVENFEQRLDHTGE